MYEGGETKNIAGSPLEPWFVQLVSKLRYTEKFNSNHTSSAEHPVKEEAGDGEKKDRNLMRFKIQ